MRKYFLKNQLTNYSQKDNDNIDVCIKERGSEGLKLCIRDDDVSYYTQPEELERAYSSLGDDAEFPVTFSVVPFSVSDHTENYPYGKIENCKQYAPIGENRELVHYLKERVNRGTGEIVLHAIHHEYRQNENGIWMPETEFLDKNELYYGILEGKKYLEEVFEINIDTFIPASNVVTNACAEVIDELGLNTNAVFTRRFNRKPTPAYICNYIKCNVYKLLFGGRYSRPLAFPNHKELCIHRFVSYDQAKGILKYHLKHDFPLVFYVHYWHLNREESVKKDLIRFTLEAIEHGAEPVLLSECFM